MLSLELVAVVLTLVAVYLTTRQVVWCWPLGMLSVALYAAVFYEARLYADTGLQGFYFLLAAYGWWAWLHNGEDQGQLRVSLASAGTRWLLVVGASVGGVVLGYGLHWATDASLPFMDSMLTAFSIAAQWMQTRKLLESWLVWLVVDLLYVGMFLYKKLYLTAGLYGVFLGLAVLGFAQWRQSMRQPRGTAPAPSVA